MSYNVRNEILGFLRQISIVDILARKTLISVVPWRIGMDLRVIIHNASNL